MKRLIQVAFCAAFTTQAHAQIDTDTDGLSDIWEAQHAFLVGPNPPASQAPGADPDGDGFTNLAESRAGTDPNDKSSFPGHAFSLIPPVYEALPPQPAPAGVPPTDPFDPNYIPPPPYDGPPPVLIDPPVSILTWPTIPGKSYEAIPSEDLADWTADTGAFLGDGTPHTFESETLYPGGIVPPKLFWRVEINDTDSDLDGLTDYEELHITDPANPTKTLDPFNPDTDGDGIPDGDEYIPGTNGAAAFTNFLTGDPDGPHGLPASLESGLIARWDLEGTHIAPSQDPYYTLARYGDSVGANHIVPFHTETKPEGMPSKGAGNTSAGVGFLCPPRTLLHNRTVYSVGMWANIEKGSLTAARPKAVLFSHHRQIKRPVPYQHLFRIDINGTWIERLPDGTQILKSGTYRYRNHYENTNTPLPVGQIVDAFEGVVSAPQPAGTFDDGKFHHYTLVRSSGIVTLYRDGALIGTNPNVTLAAINATNETATGISLGRFYGEPAESGLPHIDQYATKATFDRIRVWNRIVTAAEAEALYKQDVDSDGLWEITESRTRLWRDLNSNTLRDPGETTFSSHPLEWSPPGHDTDGDGLTDIEEQALGTDIANPDTDGDLLPDGWEVDNNLNPFSSDGDHGADGDPEGDGVTNLDEYRYNSKPRLADTDGDGKTDAQEINGPDGNPDTDDGSNPNDASDGGQQLPPAERVTILMGIGDNSGSESEDYVMNIYRIDPETGAEIRFHTLRSGGYGQYKEKSLSIFRKGESYTFQIDWQGTNNSSQSASGSTPAEGPDYDYTFKVQPQGAAGTVLIDSWDAHTKKSDTSRPILAADASDVAGTQKEFEENYEERRVALLAMEIIPDWNRDGKITAEDRRRATAENPLRWWINDDDDYSPAQGADIPGAETPDHANGQIDGMRDLIDFFPLHLDIKAVLAALPRPEYQYFLSHQEGAFKYLEIPSGIPDPDELTEHLGPRAHLTNLGRGHGLSRREVTASGSGALSLSEAYLRRAAQGKGLILFEATKATTAPIQLKIFKGNLEITRFEFPVRVSNVEDMIRHVDLTQVPLDYDGGSPGAAPSPIPTKTGDPGEPYPDTLTNGKYFVFLHGFNVPVQRARGWNTEVFKRLHQMGSKARFVGITWTGATGIPIDGLPLNLGNASSSTDYHRAVFFALQTGQSFAPALAFTQGADVTVAAHSLGNMLVGEAIQNGGFIPNRYYIINGAVPTEAYDPALATDAERWAMTEAQWKPFGSLHQQRLYASSWHTHFPASDNRSKLTWKNRFAKVTLLEHAHNFYSPGDEVVQNPTSDTALGGIIAEFASTLGVSRGAWGNQEMMKGTELAFQLQSRYQGGWGFNFNPEQLPENQGYIKENFGGLRRYYPEETPANVPGGITNEQLKTKPFFKPFKESDLFSPTLGSPKAGELKVQRDVLAAGVPARSYAIAVNNVPGIAGNHNMEGFRTWPNSWPAENHAGDSAGQWLHSDFRDVAINYLHGMYAQMIALGELNEEY